MIWSLVHELGVRLPHRSEAASSPGRTELTLSFPAFAEKAADGSYLICDELGKEKMIPFRFESRVIRISTDGEILLDTQQMGISDGFGCLYDGQCTALLCRTKWELLLISPQGNITNRISLASMSKRLPRFVSRSGDGTFLISFFDRLGNVDLIEVDGSGRMRWFQTLKADQIGIAGTFHSTPWNTFLIADPIRHVVFEIDRDGKTTWQFGTVECPTADSRHLSSPSSARPTRDGGCIVADTRNQRIQLITRDGAAVSLCLDNGGFCDPMYADQLENGNFLICDTGNARVIEVDGSGQIIWHYGNDAGQSRLLSYPRSVDMFAPDRYLIADTAHDRIVEIVDGEMIERACHSPMPLFWPRCARHLPSGGMVIADGRNRRVLEVSADGQLLRELFEVNLNGRHPFGDPHDVRVLPSGHLLVVDSMCDLVVEADWSGNVYRAVGTDSQLQLKDPHSAQQLSDGRLMIADTGNHRILIVGPDGSVLGEFDAVDAEQSRYRLNFPRYVEVSDDGSMVIADTGNNRVLAATDEGRFLWEFARVPDSKLAHLNQPRWAQLISRNEVVVCDHVHHRILHVRCDRD